MKRPGFYGFALALSLAFVAGTSGADGPITITLETFGVGGHFRTGDIIGAQFVLQGQLDKPTPIEIAWELPDGNGDIAQVTRQLVIDPGLPTTTWLYARIPPQSVQSVAMNEIYTVRVWEFEDGRRSRELGSARVSPAGSTNPTVCVELVEDIFAVVGSGRMGLDAFATPGSLGGAIPSMNVITRIARGIRPEDLPDRWEGLAQFSALIWSEGGPRALSGDAARALREWVGRGGLFIVVLPEAADPWGLASESNHPLAPLMPDWKVQRIDAVPIRELLPVVSKSTQLLNPTATMPVNFFVESGKSKAFEPLLFLPVPRDERTGFASPRRDSLDGKIVAITRSFGHGRVTIIGIDVDGLSRRALQTGGIPQADLFWNRILARRADSPSNEEYKKLADSKRLLNSTPVYVDLGRGDLVSDVIGMRGEAAVGILGAFLLFAVYWVVAGPGGFGLLKWMKLERHSWMLFATVAVVFGSGVWIIGGVVYSSRVRVQHLTVLDSIVRSSDNQPTTDTAMSRATSWFSAYLPGYGQTTVAVDPGSTRRNMLVGWSAPLVGQAETFPNPARVAVPLESSGTLTVAARATSASFETQWMGAVPSRWGKAPFAPDPKRQVAQTVIPGEPIRVLLTGLIEHTLPGPLQDVGIIHITPIRNKPPVPNADNSRINAPSDALPNIGRFAIMTTWDPNHPIELKEVLYPGGALGVDERIGDLANAIRARFVDPFTTSDLRTQVGRFGAGALGVSIDPERRRLFLDMLGMYEMLQPPAYYTNQLKEDTIVRTQRILGRSIDISSWFTTPCVIIWGYLDTATCPVPIEIGGETVPSSGIVLVRAIFPLPLDERFAAPRRD